MASFTAIAGGSFGGLVRDVNITCCGQKALGAALILAAACNYRWSAFSIVMAIQAAPERPCLLTVALGTATTSGVSGTLDDTVKPVCTECLNPDAVMMKSAEDVL